MEDVAEEVLVFGIEVLVEVLAGTEVWDDDVANDEEGGIGILVVLPVICNFCCSINKY